MSDVKTTIDTMVKKGLKALEVLSTFDQEKVDYIVAKMSLLLVLLQSRNQSV